jgi:hypothetical protein
VSILTHNVFQNLPKNLESLLEAIKLGKPKYTHTFAKKKSTSLWHVMVFSRNKQTHLVELVQNHKQVFMASP